MAIATAKEVEQIRKITKKRAGQHARARPTL